MASSMVGSGKEIGSPGLTQWNGQIFDHWISDLRTSERKVKTYDQMYRLDSTGSAMIATSSMFMCGANINVEPASLSQADQDAAQFVNECLDDMSSDFERIMSDIVMFLAYGWMDMEIVYKKRVGGESQYTDGRIGWKKWAPRHPVTLDGWEFDKNQGLQGMRQADESTGKTVFIPIEKLLHFTTTGLGKGSPEGASALEGGYKSWWTIKGLELIECITIERMSGTPVIKLPPGATTEGAESDLERAKKVVRNIKTAEDMGLTLPEGFGFEYAVPKSGPAIDVGSVIMRHKRDFARVLAMDFIMLGGGDQGSWAMHRDKSALYIKALNKFLRTIAFVINRHAVTRLMALNAFPGITGMPKVFFTPITKIDIGDYSEVIANLFTASALSWSLDTENTVRKTVGLPEITEGGITFKTPRTIDEPNDDPRLPGFPPADEKDGDDSEEEEDEKLSEFAEAPRAGISVGDAASQSDRVGTLLLRDYDTLSGALAEGVATEDDEEERESLVDEAMILLAILMFRRLRKGMFYVWNRTTGRDPDMDGMRAIMAELESQSGYVEQLAGDIKNSVMRTLSELGLASQATIALAIAGALAGFRHRVKQYDGSIFKIWVRANNQKVFNNMFPVARKAGVEIIINSATGTVEGEDVLARYEGPDDTRTCPDCESVLSKGWMPSEYIPPIGTLACNGSCRHFIAYKFRGRIFK